MFSSGGSQTQTFLALTVKRRTNSILAVVVKKGFMKVLGLKWALNGIKLRERKGYFKKPFNLKKTFNESESR